MPPVPIIIRASKRARRVSLRVRPYPLQAELVIPEGYSQRKAHAFLVSRETWIARQASLFPPSVPLLPSITVPVLGEETTISHSGSVRGLSRWEGDVLQVSGLVEQCQERVKRALKERLLTIVHQQAEVYATVLGCHYQKITLKEVSSRWGSCSSQGNLAFCWKLVFAPLPVVHYVIAHEVAHLRELNHSPRFWQLVRLLCPDFEGQRAWLKQHGWKLHRYGA